MDEKDNTLLEINLVGDTGVDETIKGAILYTYMAFYTTDEEKISTTSYFINIDDKILCVEKEGSKSIKYYIEKSSNEYALLSELTLNGYGLVAFPSSGKGFSRYGVVDKGGICADTKENVGYGDHFLKPATAAAVFGLAEKIAKKGWEIHFGDMSSENGSDPWQIEYKNNANFGHHQTHGHFGNGTGLHIDFRYLNTNGISFHGSWNKSNEFDDSKNSELFQIAYKFGFTSNYATGKSYMGVNPNVKSHYDHGHLGGSSIIVNIVKPFKFKLHE